jgi:hypothetical protein
MRPYVLQGADGPDSSPCSGAASQSMILLRQLGQEHRRLMRELPLTFLTFVRTTNRNGELHAKTEVPPSHT